RQVLDLDPNLIFAKDRQGRFTLVNRATAAAYGTTVDELLGKTDADYNANAEEVSNFRRDDLEVMTTGRDKLIPEERITDASGRLRWLRTIKRAVVSSDGSVDQVVGIASDITELKKVEDDLRRRTQLFAQQQAAFLELARMVPDQLEDAFRRIASVAARTLDVARVGIWLFSEDHSTIVCACLHAAEGPASNVGVGSVLDVERFPRYFEALAESRTIAAHDARRDPKTSEFTQTYLEPLGI